MRDRGRQEIVAVTQSIVYLYRGQLATVVIEL